MKENYCLTGTKVIMRRLFKSDSNDILSCFDDYQKLFHNPVTGEFIENVFLHGEIWGAFLNNELISCCYYYPLTAGFFANTSFYGAMEDFLPNTDKYFFMGYIGVNRNTLGKLKSEHGLYSIPSDDGIYQSFLNIGQMQAFRRGFKYVVHPSPVKLLPSLEPIFSCGFKLIKLRGMEKLVVHYIFVKAVFAEDDIYTTDLRRKLTRVPVTDTKKVSALLENGYCIVDIDKMSDEFLAARLISND